MAQPDASGTKSYHRIHHVNLYLSFVSISSLSFLSVCFLSFVNRLHGSNTTTKILVSCKFMPNTLETLLLAM